MLHFEARSAGDRLAADDALAGTVAERDGRRFASSGPSEARSSEALLLYIVGTDLGRVAAFFDERRAAPYGCTDKP